MQVNSEYDMKTVSRDEKLSQDIKHSLLQLDAGLRDKIEVNISKPARWFGNIDHLDKMVNYREDQQQDGSTTRVGKNS